MFVSGLEGLPLSLLKECRQNLLKPLEDGGVGLTSSTSGRCKAQLSALWFKLAQCRQNILSARRMIAHRKTRSEL